MSPNPPLTNARAAEAAIASVLAAEQAGRDAIAAARADAARIGELSRARSRAVAERSQQRIRRMRAAFERHTDADVAALRSQADALSQPHELDAGEVARIEHAVAVLAARLTGAAP